MTTVRNVAAAGALVMAATLVYGFTVGELGTEGSELVGLVWGQVTLVDVTLAFLVTWGWMAWREASAIRAGGLLVAIALTGSLAICLYVAVAAHRATDATGLLVGPRRR
ncbi:MAG: hypothetical protein ACLGIR_13540 [Actinomycetes bacterium]